MTDNLGRDVLALYRATFKQAVADGRAIPFVLPYSLLGPFIVPILWLTIPHKTRPWLYETRWLVMLFVLFFSIHIVRTEGSTNMAMSYAAGLTSAWGIIQNLYLLVWTKPQWDFARAVTRKQPAKAQLDGTPAATQGAVAPADEGSRIGDEDHGTLRHRKLPNGSAPIHGSADKVYSKETVRQGLDDECYWQPFPEEASFLDRLWWTVDLVASFRGAGRSRRLKTC